jgi:ABC-type branched-subunit amino acid transport system ATPase component
VNPVLETRALCKSFGALQVTQAVTLALLPGARHALIGPNGAGKTTLVNQLTGVLRPTSGTVLLDGEDITRLAVEKRVARGLSRTFQINTLFPHLSPLEAVAAAILERERRAIGFVGRWVRGVSRRTAVVDEAMGLLERLGLARVAGTPTHALAYGRQRILEIALALAGRPRVLLLDEPAAGIPEGESDELFAVLDTLPADVAILLIEHDMSLVFRFAQRITVLVGGAELVTGTPDAIAADPRVREVYLGQGATR